MERLYTITLGYNSRQAEWTEKYNGTWQDYSNQFSNHQVGPKDGLCFTPAVFRGNARKKEHAEQIDLMVLDCDNGDTLDQIKAALQLKGLAGIIHSTHSHMCKETKVSKADWDKKRLSAELYLINEKGMRPEIARGAILEEREINHYVIVHQPCPKFRVIIPLKTPWRASDHASQESANTYWKMKVKGLAQMLGLQHDQSCTDTSRLYYAPRHEEGAVFITEIVHGMPLELHTIPTEQGQNKNNEGLIHNRTDKKMSQTIVHTDNQTGKEINLVQWAAEYGKDFDLLAVLQERAPKVFTGYVTDGCKHHIRCVNEPMHTNQGEDTATFIMSPKMSDTGSFVYCCMHAHCKELDRLEFIKMMLQERWLQINDLYPKGKTPPLSYDELMAIVSGFNENTHPDKIEELINEINRAQIKPVHREAIFKKVKDTTKTTLKTLRQTSYDAAKSNIVSGDPAYDVALKTLRKFFNSGKHLIYATDGCFWEYEGKFWKRVTDELIAQKILLIVKDTIDPEKNSFNSVKKAALDILKSTQAINESFFKILSELPSIINFQNGELWIDDDGEVALKPHNPESYLFSVLDIEYTPDATCPEFTKTLLEIFANSSDSADMVRHCLEVMSYIIQPSRFLTVFFMWLGAGNNGKTKLFQTLEKVMSTNAIASKRIGDLEKDRFQLGDLMGKLLLVDDDVDKNTILPDGLLKKLSERKLLTGERKFKDHFNFVSSVAVLLLANNSPATKDISHGLIRRVRIIPFDRRFVPGQDEKKELFPRIWKNELPGIVNLLIISLKNLKKRGDFLEPIDCFKARERWLAEANPLINFLQTCCKDNNNTHVDLIDLLHAFDHWKNINKIKAHYSSQELRKSVESLGYTCKQVNGKQRVYGIHVIQDSYI